MLFRGGNGGVPLQYMFINWFGFNSALVYFKSWFSHILVRYLSLSLALGL